MCSFIDNISQSNIYPPFSCLCSFCLFSHRMLHCVYQLSLFVCLLLGCQRQDFEVFLKKMHTMIKIGAKESESELKLSVPTIYINIQCQLQCPLCSNISRGCRGWFSCRKNPFIAHQDVIVNVQVLVSYRRITVTTSFPNLNPVGLGYGLTFPISLPL